MSSADGIGSTCARLQILLFRGKTDPNGDRQVGL